jgi:hypothetical protein
LITAARVLPRRVMAVRRARVSARVTLAWGLTCLIKATRVLSCGVLAVRRACESARVFLSCSLARLITASVCCRAAC